MVDGYNSVDKLLNGGLAVNLDLNDLHWDSGVKNAITAASDLQSFRPIVTYMVSNCGNIEDYTFDGTVTGKNDHVTRIRTIWGIYSKLLAIVKWIRASLNKISCPYLHPKSIIT